MSAHLIEHIGEPHVTLTIVKGGEHVDNVEHDAAIMGAWHGRYENVHMRVFGLDGRPVEFRFAAADMLAALDYVAELSRRAAASGGAAASDQQEAAR